MKNLLLMLGFCFTICSYVQAINYERCDSEKHIVTIRKLQISPDPVHLSGENARISFDGQLHEDLPAGSRIQIKAWKITTFIAWDIHLIAPCLVPIGCDVEVCKFLEYFRGAFTCPVKAMAFNNKVIKVKLPQLGSMIKWFASGRFWIEIKITGPNNEQLSCYSIIGEARALFTPLKPVIV